MEPTQSRPAATPATAPAPATTTAAIWRVLGGVEAGLWGSVGGSSAPARRALAVLAVHLIQGNLLPPNEMEGMEELLAELKRPPRGL